jgi:hypothetical protein
MARGPDLQELERIACAAHELRWPRFRLPRGAPVRTPSAVAVGESLTVSDGDRQRPCASRWRQASTASSPSCCSTRPNRRPRTRPCVMRSGRTDPRPWSWRRGTATAPCHPVSRRVRDVDAVAALLLLRHGADLVTDPSTGSGHSRGRSSAGCWIRWRCKVLEGAFRECDTVEVGEFWICSHTIPTSGDPQRERG